jgi:predicted ATP-dependent endonuclease of OLD family
MKDIMIDGDIMIIDEPAIQLHPDGQQQILENLIEVSRNNKVIYSTNSPNMIATNIESFYIVNAAEHGTELTKTHVKEINQLISYLGASLIQQVMIGKEVFYIIVEGRSDKALFDKYLLLIGFPIEKVHIFSIDGCGKSNVICDFLESAKSKYIIMLDDDVKMNKTINIDISRVNEKQLVFVGKSTEERSLEGLLSPVDSKKLTKKIKGKKKVDINRVNEIVGIDEFSDITLSNLNNLFVETGLFEKNNIYNKNMEVDIVE